MRAGASLLVCAVLVLLAAGCGGSHRTTTAPTTTVGVYFFRDGALTRVPEQVAQTRAIGTAALGALLAGPPAGYETAIPDGVGLTSLAIAGGAATATFSSLLGAPPRPAQAQIVSTLAQFPTVRRVAVEVEGRGPVPLTDGADRPLGAAATAADYQDLTAEAPIFVREPSRGATVSSPVRAAGTANTFEATFTAEVWSAGRLLRTRTITATAGSGSRGTWSASFDLPPGPARLVFYEPSAENGSHLHTTTVDVTVR